MSAHAISCRRTDLAEFLTILFEVLTPLFAFLSEERWTTPVAVPTPEPVPPASGIIATSATPVVEVAAVLPVEVAPAPVAALAVMPETPVISSTPTAATPTTDAPAEKAEPVTTPDTAPQPQPVTPLEATAPALFVKISGRYRPAPTNPRGPLFRREVKGRKTRFVRAG